MERNFRLFDVRNPYILPTLLIIMDFGRKIRPKDQITIPGKQAQLHGLEVGDVVLVRVERRDSIEAQKRNLEEPYRRE